jgi:hypothetical protein
MSVKFPPNAAGRMAEIVTKAGRKDKETDTLLGAGFKYVKNGANKGEMVAKFSSGSNITPFQRLRNALSGKRYVATQNDISNIFRTAGMNDKQIQNAFRMIRPHGNGFSAVDVKNQLNQFQFENTKSYVTILNSEKINT